jgi:tetratricopeptide (TPR) repeat protein
MTPPTQCPDIHVLATLLGGRLDYPESERLARHLEACPSCARVAERLEVDDPLAALFRTPAPGGTESDAPRIERLIRSMCRLGVTAPLAGDVAAVADTLWDTDRALAPADQPGLIGKVGRYRVISRLGAGGMGVVYLARQERPDRAVALKVLRAAPGADDIRVSRFRSEADAAARLTHPNVVQVYEAGEDGVAFIAMELVEGESLAERLARAALAPRDAAGLLGQLSRAVHFAHTNGVIHRDLKPSNILLDRNGTPKVSDFGLARLLGDLDGDRTETGALLGTPGYMAPEQAGGGKAVGPAADVYGLGAILYECLTGRPPFKAASVLDTLEQVRTREPIPPSRLQPGVPRDLQTICLKCLEKEPARRYASAGELADDLGRFLRGEPIEARPVGAATRVWKWVRRRPAPAALIGVSVAAAVAVVTLVGVYTTRLREEVARANANAEEARRQHDRAAANYRAARTALRKMLDRVGDRRRGEITRVRELQRDQLADALAFYEGVLSGLDDPDPEVQMDAALALAHVGVIRYRLDKREAALADLGRALGLLEKLPAEYRDRTDSRMAVVTCLNYLADSAAAAGRREEAEANFRRALAEAEAAAAGDPQQRDAVAQEEHNLGAMFQSSGRPGEAEACYLRAIALREALVGGGGQALTRASLAESYANLGLVYTALRRPAEAGAAFRKADDLLRPLAEANPGDDTYGLSLSALYLNWGNFFRSGGDPRGALAKYDRACELADAAVGREPKDTAAQEAVLKAHGARAEAREQTWKFADAAADWDRALEFATDPARFGYRMKRAWMLAKAGDHVRAVAEAHELSHTPDLPPVQLYNLACIYARCVGPARSDPRFGALAGVTAAEVAAQKAVAILRRLYDDGFFRDPQNARLLSDPNLFPLWGRGDFVRLAAEVSPKKPK